jgi:class 3 adenylate cyclase
LKIFIAWSGLKSGEIATALAELLRSVTPSAKPWVFSRSIPSNQNWHEEILHRITSAEVGIVCITKENRQSPSLLFEIGALATRGTVLLYLIDISGSELPSPVAQFQAVHADKNGTWTLVETINSNANWQRLPIRKLRLAFENHWSRFGHFLSTADKVSHEQLVVMLVDSASSVLLSMKGGLQSDASSLEQIADRTEHLLRNNGGVFVKRTGDGALGFFTDAVEAIKCAEAIQNSVNESPIIFGGQLLRVKISISSGTVIRGPMSYGEDIVGAPVLTAARLMSAARPGETVLSFDTVRSLPPEVRRSLGKSSSHSNKSYKTRETFYKVLPGKQRTPK